MKNYNLDKEAQKILNNNVVNMVSMFYEYKGKHTLYIENCKNTSDKNEILL